MDGAQRARELATRLRTAGLLHLERMLFENGYDNYKFVHNVFEEPDIPLLHIPERDAAKLLRFVQSLPPAEFQPQVPLKTQQENKAKGVATLQQWLNTIALPEYLEFFKWNTAIDAAAVQIARSHGATKLPKAFLISMQRKLVESNANANECKALGTE
uniref:Uncharacterized protein LOC108051526 n=1 Tax=Drosophila rhopaloa TaxID=1041015 RepID=A0A6P4FGT3_DRORH